MARLASAGTAPAADADADTASAGPWVCGQCTLVNTATYTRCAACDAPRDAAAGTGTSAGAAGSGGAGANRPARSPSRAAAALAAATKRAGPLAKEAKTREKDARILELDTLVFMQRVANKLLDSPDAKFRRLKIENKKFAVLVWKHAKARGVFEDAGWSTAVEDGYVVLPGDENGERFLQKVYEHLNIYVIAKQKMKPHLRFPEREAAAEQARFESERRLQMISMKRQKKADREAKANALAQYKNDRDRHSKDKIWAMIKDNRCAALQPIISSNPELMSMEDEAGRTPLLLAAAWGVADAVAIFLDKGADIDSRATDGCTALHGAACSGHANTTRLLLERNAAIDAIDLNETTPLALAAASDNAATVEILLERGACCDVRDKCSRTPLMLAGLSGSVQCVIDLLDAGASIVATDKDNRTALICACIKGSSVAVQILLDRGSDAEAKDAKDRTPLSRAAGNDNREVVQLLLDRGANLAAADMHGATAMWHACAEDSAEVLQVLLAHGADVATVDRRHGQSAVEIAIENGSHKVIQLLRTIPGLDLPEIPEYDLPNHGRADSSIVAKKGLEMAKSSLDALQRIYEKGGQIFPRRLQARFEGEVSYGEGVTRQWVGQLGRELLIHCDKESDRPVGFRVGVVAGGAEGGGDDDEGPDPDLFLTRFGDSAGSVWPDLVLVRNTTYTFTMVSRAYAKHKVAFTRRPPGSSKKAGAAGATGAAAAQSGGGKAATAFVNEMGMATDADAAGVFHADVCEGTSIVTITFEVPKHCPSVLYLSNVNGTKCLPVKVVDKSYCRKHGAGSGARCQLVVGSELLSPQNDHPIGGAADDGAAPGHAGTASEGEEVLPYHLVGLSPLSDPQNDSEARGLLRGLGRILGIALCTSCPLGIRLSPAFAKHLLGLGEDIGFDDLRATMPALQHQLLRECLDTASPHDAREEKLTLYKECSYDRFLCDSLESMRAAESSVADFMPARQNSAVCDDGESKEITLQNIREYATWLAQKQLNGNVMLHAEIVRQGIGDVRGALLKLRSLADWQSVQKAFLGSLTIDVDEWMGMVTIENGRAVDGPVEDFLGWFWASIRKLSNPERCKLLYFWTAEAPPAGGLTHLDRKLSLQISEDAGVQPKSATCFYSMVLPRCTTEEQVAEVSPASPPSHTYCATTNQPPWGQLQPCFARHRVAAVLARRGPLFPAKCVHSSARLDSSGGKLRFFFNGCTVSPPPPPSLPPP